MSFIYLDLINSIASIHEIKSYPRLQYSNI